MLTKKCIICPMSINLHGVVPSVELKNKLRLLDPHFNNLYQFNIYEVYHCDGLLICTHQCTSQYECKIVVSKPCTGQTRWIEVGNLCKNDMQFVLGYSQATKSCSKSYPILSFKYDGENSEIYDLNSDSWRRILDDDIILSWSFVWFDEMVSLKGNIYWFAHEKAKMYPGICLFRFDFATEKTSVCVALPYPDKMYETLSISVVREEKISMLLQRDYKSKTEIWVFDETKAVSWSKVLTLDLSHDLQTSNGVSFLLDEEKKVVVCCGSWEDEDKWKVKIYIVGEDNEVTTVDSGVATSKGCWPVIFNYVPSLVQIE